MSILKSLIIALILTSFVVAVFAARNGGDKDTPPDTGNNVCDISKKDLFNGTQNPDGECVTTVMGEIPSKQQMISTLILFPPNNQVIKANTPFTVKIKSTNLITGFFDDPAKQYYLFPQTLNKDGVIQGHSHITIQEIKDENNPPDAQIFAFFKGLNDPAVDGILSTQVDKGLPAGNYRACTMTSSFAHQPVLMPVAQRGSQDDCTRFTVENNNKKRFPRFSRRFFK